MEIDQKTIETVQLEELSIDKVCRTCLCTSEDSMISLYEEEMLNKLNFFDMINQTFGKIVKIIDINYLKIIILMYRFILGAIVGKFTKWTMPRMSRDDSKSLSIQETMH